MNTTDYPKRWTIWIFLEIVLKLTPARNPSSTPNPLLEANAILRLISHIGVSNVHFRKLMP